MKIRGKIVLVVLPLVVTPIVLSGLIASLLARNGITTVAAQFLQFKGEQIASYAASQWSLLEDNGLTEDELFVEAAVTAIEGFARNVVRTDGELIFGVDSAGTVDFAAGAVPEGGIPPDESRAIASETEPGWRRLEIAGIARVAHVQPFGPLGWTIVVSERQSAFYAATNRIIMNVGIVLAASIIAAIILLFVLASYLTNPLRNIVTAMTEIITTNDLSSRVEVLYNDETGILGQRFNLMIQRLEEATTVIKREALKRAIAQNKEQRIRNIFQKYVPAHVIDEVFERPDEIQAVKDEVLAVLFSDIRSFTSISENLNPKDIVESLNEYFTLMVDAITNHDGIADKYMGDAIMAYFGAPVKRDDDAYRAVQAGLDMLDSLKDFNVWQEKKGRKPFKIGIGINYGVVTVGNIGSDKKMDYTVIGDMVNVANRLEGLTKTYGQPFLVSESVLYKQRDKVPHRLMDKVIVKGRAHPIGVFAVQRELNEKETEAWALHEKAMTLYYDRQFDEAGDLFAEVLALMPMDQPARTMVERCVELAAKPPSDSWTGVMQMGEK